MRTLSLNYQGLWNPWIVRSLRKIVRDQAPMVCFIMETRLDRGGFKKHCKGLPFKNKLIVKKPNTRGGVGATLEVKSAIRCGQLHKRGWV